MYPVFIGSNVVSTEVVDSSCVDCPGAMYGVCEECEYSIKPKEVCTSYDVLPMIPEYPESLNQVPF